MIYLFHGSDVERVRAKAFAWVVAARSKEPNLAYIRLAREELTPAVLEDAAAAGGLFVSRLLILLDDPFPSSAKATEGRPGEDNEGGDSEEVSSASMLEEHLDALAASDNAIVILAPKLLAAKAKKIVAKAKLEYRFDKPTSQDSRGGFNSALVNALAERSREKLWLEIIRALRAGDAPEMLHGLLHWKVRDLMEKGSPKWSSPEARTLSLSLISLLQDSRRKGLNLSRSLERFALSI